MICGLRVLRTLATSRHLDHMLGPLPTGATGVWRDVHPPQESTFPWRTLSQVRRKYGTA